MVERVWLTSECVAKGLQMTMLPERCYQLQSRWEAETRSSDQMPKIPACYHRGGRTEAFGPGAETPGWSTTATATM